MFQVDEQSDFWENYGESEKRYRYQACNNQIKKKLFSVTTKLSHSIFFFSEYLLAIRIKKLIYLSIKLVYLGFAILEIIKAVTCVS